MKEKVVRYSQFHIDHKTSEALKAQGLPVAEYDGGVNMWANSVEDLMMVSWASSHIVIGATTRRVVQQPASLGPHATDTSTRYFRTKNIIGSWCQTKNAS